MNSHSEDDKTWRESVELLRKQRAWLLKYDVSLNELIISYPSLKRKADSLKSELWSRIRSLDDKILDITFTQLELPLE